MESYIQKLPSELKAKTCWQLSEEDMESFLQAHPDIECYRLLVLKLKYKQDLARQLVQKEIRSLAEQDLLFDVNIISERINEILKMNYQQLRIREKTDGKIEGIKNIIANIESYEVVDQDTMRLINDLIYDQDYFRDRLKQQDSVINLLSQLEDSVLQDNSTLMESLSRQIVSYLKKS